MGIFIIGVGFVIYFVLSKFLFSRPGTPSTARASRASVILNEVLFSPAQGQFQFVELKGTNADGALAQFSLVNQKGEKYLLPGNLPTLKQGEYLLITFDGESRLDGRTLHADRKTFLNSSSGFVQLQAPDGRIVDRVAWGAKQPGAVSMGRGGLHGDFIAGTSVGRFPLSVESKNRFEWLTFSKEEVTPGAQNPNPRVEILLPLNGAFFSQTSVTLNWYPVAGATRYRVQVAKDSAFKTIAKEAQVEPPESTHRFEAGEYFWRVQSIFADGSSANYSPSSSFTISQTEFPVSSVTHSISLLSSAYAANVGQPIREKALSVPMIMQHKDTAMLCLESENPSGKHAWDRDHGTYDRRCKSDRWNCAPASIAMVNHFARGNLSQDRIGYEYMKGMEPGPTFDIYYGTATSIYDTDKLLSFAFNGSAVTRHGDAERRMEQGLPAVAVEDLWTAVTREIDAKRPFVAASTGHVYVTVGYHQFAQTGPNARFVSINDPAYGRYLMNLNSMAENITSYWLVSDTSNPRNNEPGVKKDSDGDGMVDFDETERFKTDPNNRDSDDDGVNDKTEVYASVFDPNHGYVAGDHTGLDFDGDGFAMELDEDSDGGGCTDGDEDKNGNGKRDGSEKYNFDKEDDDCGVRPLGGRVKMTYTYIQSGSCTGQVEIRARFTLKPEPVPVAPNIVLNYRADTITYDIATDGCVDTPGDHVIYEFKEGFHLSGTLPLTEENLGFVMFWPTWSKFSMQLPYELTEIGGANTLKGTYTTTSGGGPWPADTYVVFAPLNIESDPAHCADANYSWPNQFNICVEPTPCSDQLNAPMECLSDPQRYYVIPSISQ